MVCPNCHSTDIVVIQGQNYCINCGQLVPGSAAKSVVPKPEAAATPEPTVTSTVKTAPIKVQAPDLRADLSKAAIKSVTPIINHSRPQKVEPTPVGRLTKPTIKAAEKIATKKEKVVTPPISHPDTEAVAMVKPVPPIHTLDLRHADKPEAKEPAKPAKPMPAPKPPVRKHAPAARTIDLSERPKQPPRQKADGLGAIFKNSMRSLWFRDFWPYSLLVSALVALPVAASVYLAGNDVMRLSELPANSGWLTYVNYLVTTYANTGGTTNLLAAVLIGYLLISELGKNFSVGAIVYGSVKLADRRDVSPRSWTRIGLNTVWANFGLDIEYVFLAGVTAAIASGAEYWLYLTQLTSAVKWGLGGLVAVVAVFVLLGLTIARLLARNAVVLGGYTSPAALFLGWRLYIRKLFFVLAAGLIVVLVNLVGAGVFSLLAMTIIAQTAHMSTQPALGSALASLYVLVSMLVFSLLFIFNITFWQQVYRSMVTRAMPDMAAKLVSSRRPAPVNRLSLVILWLLPMGLVAAVALAVWPR